MKNLDKLQIEAFKELIGRSKSLRYSPDGNMVYLSFDGFRAFAVPKKDVCIDLDKAVLLDGLKQFFRLDEKDVELKQTEHCDITREGKYLLELAGENFSVWVNKAFFDRYYDGQKILCSSPVSPVKFVSRVGEIVEAIILPVRRNEKDA